MRTPCNRPKRNGEPCELAVHPGAPACKYHMTAEERRSWDAEHPPQKRPKKISVGRLSAHELEKAVNGTKHAAPKKAAAAPVHPDDAQIVLAAMRMYADRVTALVDQLSSNLDSTR